MRISAQDLCTTRTCEAADCPDDADLWGLCTRHARQQARGEHVRMHVVPDALPDMLRCSSCNVWQPDAAFPMKNRTHRDGRLDRRGRHYECRACASKRRSDRVYTPEQRAIAAERDKARRANWTPEQRERSARMDRERRARKRAELETLRQTLDSQAGVDPQ